MVFFVLSGYVIAYVADQREKTLADYTYARMSRLYSVIVPVLFLTLIINVLGNQYNSELYSGHWYGAEGVDPLRYFLTFFLLHNVWDLGLYPGNNAPFWSLTFEAFYYAIFATFFYLKSLPKKLVIAAFLVLLAGPTIIALFPIWMAGYWVYRLHSCERLNVGLLWSLLLFVSCAAAMGLSPFIRSYLSIDFPGLARDSVLGDYIDGLAFSLIILVVPSLLVYVRGALLAFATPIVFLASLTFTLYLIHQPLVRFIAGISPFIADPASWQNRVFVIVATLSIILVIAVPCERLKRPLNSGMRSAVDLVKSMVLVRKA